MYLICGWNGTRTALGQFLSPRSRGHGRRTIGDARAGSGGADAAPRCIGRCTVFLCDLLGRVLSWNDEDLVEFHRFSTDFMTFDPPQTICLWKLHHPTILDFIARSLENLITDEVSKSSLSLERTRRFYSCHVKKKIDHGGFLKISKLLGHQKSSKI